MWGFGLFFLFKLPKPLLFLLLITTTLNGSSRAEGDLSWSVSTSDAFFSSSCAQMLPGTLHLTLSSWEWPLPYNLSDERDGVFKKKTSVYFTFISSHSASLNRWVAYGEFKRKRQNAAVCQLCLHYISQVIF